MNKLFTKIATTFVGIVMAIGVGVAVGSNSDVRRANADDVTDKLTRATTGSTGTSYSSWSGKTLTSEAVYAGNSAGGNSSIQLRSSNSSGIWTTTSGGTIKSVTVTWNSNTASGRTLNVYGSDSTLSSPGGTLVGTIVYGTSTSYSFTTNYSYVAVKSSSNALYLTDISFTWDDGSSSKINTTTSVSATKTTLDTGKNPADYVDLVVTVKDASDNTINNPSLSFLSSNTSVATVSNAGRVTAVAKGNTTITVSYLGDTTYKASSSTIGISVQTPFPASGTISITGSHPTISGSYGTNTPYVVEVDDNPGSEFGFNCTDVMKNNDNLQFKKSSGKLYNTTPLQFIQSVVVSGSDAADAVIKYGTTSSDTGCTNDSPGTNSKFFKITNGSSNARYWQVTINYGQAITLDSITAELDSTAAQKTWHVNDPLTAAEVDVTPSYSDGSGTKVEDGTGVYFNSELTDTTYTFSATGNVTVPVYYQDANGRTANTTFTVNNVQPGKTVQAFSLTGSIGETVKTKSYDLSGLELHAWYDTQMTDEAPANVVALYELVANPTAAGDSADPNNKIDVEVHLKSDHSKVHTFENISAPITDAPKGSEDNPFTVAEAIAAIGDGSSVPAGTFYATGFIKNFGSDNYAHCIWLVDNPDTDMELPDTSCLEAYLNKSTAVPTPEGVDFDNDIYPYDKVTISGTMKLYNSQPEFTEYAITEWASESIELVLSQSEDTLTYKSPFSYSGTITADFAIWNDKVLSHSDVTFTGYDTSTVGDQTVTVSYTHPMYEDPLTATYTLHVVYAEVSSVTLTEHSINMGVNDNHQFSASLNEGVNPSNVISWSVVNGSGSNIPTNEFSINSSGYLTVNTETSGTLVVTASCSGHEDHCTVTVTGDPYATFNKASIKGIAKADIDNSVTAIPNGLAGTPTSYAWSIKTGEATDVISFTNGNASTTLTFLKAGSTVLHVVISDGSAKTAEGDIDVDVIDSLNSVVVPGKASTHSDIITFSEVCIADQTYNEQTISSTEFGVYFDKGTNSNAPVYKTTGTAMRIYGGGYFRVSSSHQLSKIELTFGSGDNTNAITTDVGLFSTNTWTGTSNSVTFNIGGTTGHRRVASVKVYWETTGSDTPVSNINYNSQKAILDFASQFSTMLNNVCDQATGDTPMSGDDGLIKKWGDIQSAFTNFRNSLSTSAELGEMSEREIFDALIANAGKDQGGDALEKALSSYDYVYSKYHAALDGEVAGSADFLHNVSERDPVSYSPRILPTLLVGKVTNTSIIVIVTVGIAAIAIGGYFLLRKKKED